MRRLTLTSLFFFFNDTATTEIYTLSLHDALPIHQRALEAAPAPGRGPAVVVRIQGEERGRAADRSGIAGGDRARRERAPGRKPPARDGAADRRPERIQPLVRDLRP